MPYGSSNNYLPSPIKGENQNDALPVLFQVISPDNETPLFPTYLYLHVNPSSLDFSYSKVIARSQTRGGFIEQHFGEELTSISADQSSGAFINTESGVTAIKRRDTPAWRKMKQLIGVFKSNGLVHDDRGQVKFKGRVRINFSGGIYDGYFTSFEISESAEEPFVFSLSWDFTVEEEKYNLIRD